MEPGERGQEGADTGRCAGGRDADGTELEEAGQAPADRGRDARDAGQRPGEPVDVRVDVDRDVGSVVGPDPRVETVQVGDDADRDLDVGEEGTQPLDEPRHPGRPGR
ncbi:hypothetical protein EAO75_09305 [Streptomyces sp. uw30]|uniref:hypothetical protein n=1 Tax=Streptomyces sp. uw30 TaxID=1828179 RepID=UPI0011CD564C|nr:hypothetical protein [Streptomyces sp. uw30]TXS51947.1 hypothetical protein EAO75_09305 [Streptomyces sp. uw30]